MSFFGPIWRVLGFEDDKKDDEQKKQKTKLKATNGAFDLTDKNFHKQSPTTRNARNQDEVEQILEELKIVKTLIVDMSNFQQNRQRSLDFISGAIFALDGELKKLDTDKFYCNLNIGEE